MDLPVWRPNDIDLMAESRWFQLLSNISTDSSVTSISDAMPRREEQLYQVPYHFIILLSLAYGLVSLSAVLGNFLVLWGVVRSSKLRTVTTMYIANLAIADILIGALAIPFQFQVSFHDHFFKSLNNQLLFSNH